MIYASVPFYPKDIWFYVKANNPSLKYPDSVHAVELRKVSQVIDSIKEMFAIPRLTPPINPDKPILL